MSVAPLIPPQESSSAASQRPSARPKRISPPSHWKDAAPTPSLKKAVAKPALPVAVAPAVATDSRVRLSPVGFGIILVLGTIALNALLLWFFPLPPLQNLRHEAPAFSPAPMAEDNELPVWLRP